MRIAVVGAGPAGATLALLLARYGADVRLMERESAPGAVFRGEGLLPLGLDALRQMGLGAALRDVPGQVVTRWRIWVDGDEVLTVPEPVAELGERAFRIISPAALLDRVLDAAGELPNFSFHPDTRFADVVRDAGGRVVGVRAVTRHAGEVRWTADLVVGCDGRGSSVRRHGGLVLNRSTEDYDVLSFKVPAPDVMREWCEFLIMIRSGCHPLAAYLSWDDRLQCAVIVPRGGLAEFRDDGWLAAALAAAPPGLREHVRAHAREVTAPVRLNVVVGRAPSWSAPGLLLLGDAAHPMSPVRAQGINLALRDVIVAANHLVPLLTGGRPAAVDAACRAIQAEREPEVRRAQQLQRREARSQGDAWAGTWRHALAKRGAAALGRYAWAQRAWLDRQHELRFGSTRVELRLPGGPG